MKLRVIDVSEHQSRIDWERVKPQIDGAILRTGYGGDYPGQQDDTFTYNAEECTRLGIPFGVYHYSYADTEEKAVAEANHILRLIKPYKLSYPVYLDLEEERDSIRSFAPQACQIIGDIIEKAGYWFGVYANLNWWENYLVGVDKYTKWVAQYNSVCEYGKKYDIWQYSSSGRVDGISGSVDMNYCYRDFPAEIGSSKKEPEKPAAFTPYLAKVTAQSGLNLRKGPGTGYDWIRTLADGAVVTVTMERDGWGHLYDGWVSLKYIKRLGDFKPYKVRVTPAVGLNCRKGPGAQYDSVTAYPCGTELTILREQEGWGQTDKGWVCLKYSKRI